MAAKGRVTRTRRGAKAVDPTQVRLSKHFLLSDLMGCNSVYRLGHSNVFSDPDGSKLAEGRYLAEQVLEPVLHRSPVSVSYGYISRDLAAKIVKYQSADKPSYHQWNDGAACDLLLHKRDRRGIAPIYTAKNMDRDYPLSRLITYSESPFICAATKLAEKDTEPRRAFYENRFEGVARTKPKFIKVPWDRKGYFCNHELDHDWRGAGYPTYHGGGHKQLHHIRVGKYNMLSDFLYSTEAMEKGHKNFPPITNAVLKKFKQAAALYAELLDGMKIPRLSIVRAYESVLWSKDETRNWTGDCFSLDMVLPEGCEVEEFYDVVSTLSRVRACSGVPKTGLVSVVRSF